MWDKTDKGKKVRNSYADLSFYNYINWIKLSQRFGMMEGWHNAGTAYVSCFGAIPMQPCPLGSW